MKIPPCKKCNNTEFFNMPDSLAWACKKCGFVWVDCGDHWEEGKSIQQWLQDTDGNKKQ